MRVVSLRRSLNTAKFQPQTSDLELKEKLAAQCCRFRS